LQDAHWPKEKGFWDSFGGRLTPVGINQQLRLGERMRKRYIDLEHLLDDQAPGICTLYKS
jgi:hypothetical protein